MYNMFHFNRKCSHNQSVFHCLVLYNKFKLNNIQSTGIYESFDCQN